jgi:hypothetical protein
MKGACLTALISPTRAVCYHELYDIVTKLPTAVNQSIRILLTGTPQSSICMSPVQLPTMAECEILLFSQPADSENEVYAFAAPKIVWKGTYYDFGANGGRERSTSQGRDIEAALGNRQLNH